MICTVTFNPAVDYVVHVDELTPGTICRAKSESIHFGGKGINVARSLRTLGVPVLATGFAGGRNGDDVVLLHQPVREVRLRAGHLVLGDLERDRAPERSDRRVGVHRRPGRRRPGGRPGSRASGGWRPGWWPRRR